MDDKFHPMKDSCGDDSTQTIELTDLFTRDLTTTGSFDIRSDIWRTTFGKVVQSLPLPTLLIDQHFQIIVANDAWRKISEDFEEMLFSHFSTLFPDASASQRAQALLEEIFSTRRSRVAQGTLEIGSKRIWARITFRSIRISKKRFVLALIEDLTSEKKLLEMNKAHSEELESRVEARTSELTATNERLQIEITERRKAEELLLQSERLKAIGELASGTAHNFNNLLQIVISGAQLGLMSLESGNQAKARKAFEQILESARFGSETVRRLQSFTSIRNGGESEKDSLFDLRDVVRPAVELTKPWWKTHPEKSGMRVSLKLDLKDTCPIVGKKHEMFEVAVNLIKNAAEALPHGGFIEVRCYVQQNEVIFQVRDTGIGIPKDLLDRLFIPFSTTKLTAGAGLGLATSRAIVERHGGKVSVESVEGGGSTFRVRLPKSTELPEVTGAVLQPEKGQALRILVIDDMATALDLLADGLREFDHTVHTALSGEQGIEMFNRIQVDLVICDLGMPGTSGWDVSKEVMKICQERRVRKTPFLLLTGWGDQVRETDKMNESGVNRIIAKPVGLQKLLEVVGSLVQE